MAYKSYTRRKYNHDYYGPFIYHIILKKQKGAVDFGKIVGNAAISPGKPGSAKVDYSKLGYAIFNALKAFDYLYPEFQKEQYSIMPDHVHIILNKLKRTPIHLKDYIKLLKELVAEKYKEEGVAPLIPDEIFEDNFTDKLLFRNIKLKDWINYVKHNPHRRAMTIQYPHFFQRVTKLVIDNKIYEAYGNLFLFRNPDKFAVRIRRNFSSCQISEHKNEALDKVREGSVLVSPFISPYEKEIREEALRLGSKIILVQLEEFGERYKPSKREFDLCSKGRLLIISLGLPKGTEISYTISTSMNELASKICQLSLAKD